MRNPTASARNAIICSAIFIFAIQAVTAVAVPLKSGPIIKTSTLPKVGVPINKVTLVRPLNSQPIFVSADYIRMHLPDLIVGLVSEIKSGKMPASALSPLVGSDIITRLLSSNMAPLTNRLNLAQSLKVNNGLSAAIDYNSVTQSNPAPLLTLPGSEYSPHNIDENPIAQNQSEYIRIKFTTPLSEAVTASLSNSQSGHIQIRWIRSYTGQWQPTPAPNGPLQPIIASQANPGGSLNANAGQDCTVEMKLNFPNTGDYNSSLTIVGNGQEPWSLTVPIKVHVTDMGDSGAVASVDDTDIMMTSNQRVYVPITITPIHYRLPFIAVITASSLPNGISMPDMYVPFASGAEAHVKMILNATSSELYLNSAPMKFTVDANGSNKTEFHSSITVEPYWVQWQFPTNTLNAEDGAAALSWNNPTVDLTDTGNWYLSGRLWSNSDTASNGNAQMTFGFMYATSTTTARGEAGWVDLTGSGLGPTSGWSQGLRDNWSSYIRLTPACWVMAGLNTNPPWILSTSPSITITPM